MTNPSHSPHEHTPSHRTLHLLSTLAPPHGMEARLQTALARRADAAANRRDRPHWLTNAGLQWTLAATAALALVLVGLSWRNHAAHAPAPRVTSVRQPPRSPQPALLAQVAPPALDTRPHPRSRTLSHHRASPSLSPSHAAADPTYEPSHPAPAAPLTEQERLLITLARRWEASQRPEIATLVVSEPVLHHGLPPLSLPLTSQPGEDQ